LGLERYEQVFRENRIEADILPSLTVEDLKDLGVTLVGDRRRLLDAIAALDSKMPAVAVPAVLPDTPAQADAERRQLTVMFCDLVASTALSARLDPEDLREVIAAYQRAVAEVVTEFDGFVAKYMGDGVLIYFGYPRAHEDDAERAVRAGLSLIDAVARLDVKSVKLRARVGIATGLVVVGDLIGEGSAREQSVVGETPNLAARLQGLAEPDAVVIAAGTRRLVGDFFEYGDLGAVEVRGIATPVRAWRVLRPSVVASRFEALHGAALTPLVGRDEEIDLLLRRWARTKAGDGQVVMVSGEAGVGKSRIAAALEERLHTEPHIRLRYFCSPYHQDSALFPFIDQLGRASGFARDDTPAAKLEKLEAVLAQAAPPDEDVAFLADLLSLPASERYRLPSLSPQRKKDRTLDALIRQLEGLARRKPVVMVFEDAHWIDPTSRELLDLTVERVRGLPVLLLVTFRPEFQPPWTGQPQVSMVALNRLDRRDRSVLVEQIAGGKALPNEVVAQIVDRTDGVPLFVEELTKNVLESGLLREEADRYVLDGALPPLAIPTTLHDSLMARLDRLGSVRLVAQIGAAIGREFSYELLRAVSRLPEDELQGALVRIVASELVFLRGSPPDAVYAFKHALVQEAAYRSLLNTTRQRYHLQIAQVFVDQFPESVDTRPELLARHYSEAGLPERAATYWHMAGQQASQRSAHKEAVAYLTRGLSALGSLPDTVERGKLELELQTALGPVLMASEGYASLNAGRAYRRAEDLCRRLGEPSQIFQVLLGLRQFNHIGGALESARELGEQLLAIARRTEDRTFLVQAHTMLGHSLCYLGEFTPAREHLEKAIALYDRRQHRAHVLLSGIDPGVLCRSASAWVLWHLGYPDQALERAHATIELATELSHPQSLAQALGATAQVHQFRREAEQAREFAEREIALASEHGFQMRVAMATILRGWAMADGSERAQGIAQMQQGFAAYRATGAGASGALYHSLLAERYERTEDAHLALEEALAWASSSGEQWCEAEVYRLRGMLLLRQVIPDDVQAEHSFRRALDISKSQHAKSWQLRASVSLSRLWMGQGKHAAARQLLSQIYDWFTDGLSSPDLTGARQLLVELDHASPN
jgi:class 3 adenylate cyclase/predicted ATPase